MKCTIPAYFHVFIGWRVGLFSAGSIFFGIPAYPWAGSLAASYVLRPRGAVLRSTVRKMFISCEVRAMKGCVRRSSLYSSLHTGSRLYSQ